MNLSDARSFLQQHHRMVVTTHGRAGSAQMSVVLGGPFDQRVSFVARGDSAKVRNLKNDPRISVLVVTPDWRGWVTVEGTAEIKDWVGTDPEELRVLLRDTFMAAGGRHNDWDEYDRTMREENRAVVLITPQRVYGQHHA